VKNIPVTHISPELVGMQAKKVGASRGQTAGHFLQLLAAVSDHTQRLGQGKDDQSAAGSPVAQIPAILKQLGLPPNEMKLSSEALPRLRNVLLKQGFSLEQAEGILARSTSEGGDILVDTLATAVLEAGGAQGAGSRKLLISRDQRPQLEGLLASLKVPSQTISPLTQQAQTSTGDINVRRLTTGLQSLFPELKSVDLVNLLKSDGISMATAPFEAAGAPGAGSRKLLISRDQRPQLEGLLASLKVPSETISPLTQQAQTSAGDIDVARLTTGLQSLFPELKGVDLVDLLKSYGISMKEQHALSLNDQGQTKPSIGDAKSGTAALQMDHGQRLELASRLRQEGVLPEQVKSLLERVPAPTRGNDSTASSERLFGESENRPAKAPQLLAKLAEASPAGNKQTAQARGTKGEEVAAVSNSSPSGETENEQPAEASGSLGTLGTADDAREGMIRALATKFQPPFAGVHRESVSHGVPRQASSAGDSAHGGPAATGQEQAELEKSWGGIPSQPSETDGRKIPRSSLAPETAPVPAEGNEEPVSSRGPLLEALGMVRAEGSAQTATEPILVPPRAAMATQDPDLAPYLQLGQRLVYMTTNGEYLTRMDLHPPDLGRVNVEIRLEDSRLRVALITESPAVKAVMETHIQELRQHLSQNNLHLEQFRVTVAPDFSAFQQSHQGHLQGENGGGQPDKTVAANTDVEGPEELPLGHGLSLNDHQIDLFA